MIMIMFMMMTAMPNDDVWRGITSMKPKTTELVMATTD